MGMGMGPSGLRPRDKDDDPFVVPSEHGVAESEAVKRGTYTQLPETALKAKRRFRGTSTEGAPRFDGLTALSRVEGPKTRTRPRQTRKGHKHFGRHPAESRGGSSQEMHEPVQKALFQVEVRS
jgi:hypothetical protein